MPKNAMLEMEEERVVQNENLRFFINVMKNVLMVFLKTKEENKRKDDFS